MSLLDDILHIYEIAAKYHTGQKIQCKVKLFYPLKIPMACLWAVFTLVLQEVAWQGINLLHTVFVEM